MDLSKKNKWYLVGKWVEPVLSMSFWVEFKSKELGIDYFGDVETLDCNYFLLQEDMDKSVKFVEEKIVNNKDWFERFFLMCDEKITDTSYYRNNKDLSKFLESLSKLLNHNMLIHILDYSFLKLIEKISIKNNIPVEDVLVQIKPFKKTILMSYQEELKSLEKHDFEEFIKKYKWVGTHLFMGQPLDLNRLNIELEEVFHKKEDIAFRELPPEYKDIIEICSKLAFYRSFVIENANSLMYEYWSDIEKLGEKYNLIWDEVLLLTYKELIELNDFGILPKEFKSRKNSYGLVLEDNKMSVVTGEELKSRLDECQDRNKSFTELKGMVASKGGKVRGTVRIIEESKYLSKMQKGDILVANDTTPDYVVGMRIAGAIITNMGGITSHAAITSREMKIPCIIGTKIATKVLKDGDFVEVDADNGIVRIIK